MPRYQDKVVIVTGGSKGIGAGIVEEFIKEGAHVVFCSRNAKEGAAYEEKLKELGPGTGVFCRCDTSKEEDLKNLVDFTVKKYEKIDCLVNNAGWHPPPKEDIEFTRQEFMDLLNLNLVSYFTLSCLCIPYLRKTQGNIINMSSLVGHMGQSKATTYCATKGAIHSMTKAMAIDEAPYNVRVNSVSPGNIWTPLYDDWINSTPDPKKTLENDAHNQHLTRLGTIEECGKLCVYLAADATYNTGTDTIISGGSELGYGNKFTRPTY